MKETPAKNSNYAILDTIIRAGGEEASFAEIIQRQFKEIALHYQKGFMPRGGLTSRGDKQSSDTAKVNAENGLEEPALERLQERIYHDLGSQMEAFIAKEQTLEAKKAASNALQGFARTLSSGFILIDQGNDFYCQTMLDIIMDAEQPQRLRRYLSQGLEQSNEHYLSWVRKNADLAVSKHLPTMLARAAKEVPLWEQTLQPQLDKEKGEEANTKTLRQLQYDAPKKQGNELGFIARKKVRPDDDETKKKYQYRWMVKKNGIDPTEKLGADIHRWFLGDRAPKTRLVTSNDGTEVLIASRFIDNFKTLQEVTSPRLSTEEKKDRKKILGTAYGYAFNEVPGTYRVVAVALAAGNIDFHLENMGQVTLDPSSPDKVEAAIVDFGRSLNFNADARMDKILLPGIEDIQGNLAPADILRGLHKKHYHLNSDYFLNEVFAGELETVASQIEKGHAELAHVIHSSANEVRAAYKNFPQPWMLEGDIIDHAGFGVTMDNLGQGIADIMTKERPVVLRDLAAQIRIQVALKEQDTEKLAMLLREFPEFATKEVKWLTMDDSEALPPPSTLKHFALGQRCPAGLIDVIEKAEAVAQMEKIHQAHYEGEKETEKPLVTGEIEYSPPVKATTKQREILRQRAVETLHATPAAPVKIEKQPATEGNFTGKISKERGTGQKKDTHSL